MAAALLMPSLTQVGRAVVYIASAVNLVLLALAIDTVLDAKAGKLQAQQDFGVAVAIVLYGGATAVACLVTLVVGGVVGIRREKPVPTLFANRIFWLAVVNVLSPAILVLGMRWLLRG